MARFALILALAFSVAAQDSSTLTGTVKTENGLHVATFDTLQGTVTVNLPDDLAAGDTISGTVVAEAKGDDPEQKAANAGTLSGVVVEMADQEAPKSDDGKAKWIVPAAAAVAIPLILRDGAGRVIGKVSVPVAKAPKPAAQGFQVPAAGQAGKPVAITGSFDGDFATSGVKLAGNAMKVLAESPRKLIAQAPPDFSGTGDIEVSERDVVQKCIYRNIAVKLSAPNVNLKSGQTTTMTITVEGLAGLDKAFPVSLINRSPAVVRVAQGDAQTIQVDPKKSAGGSFVATRTLTGVVPGGFNINATIPAGSIPSVQCATVQRAASPPHPTAAQGIPTDERPSTTAGALRPPEPPREEPPPPEGPDDPERLRNAAVAVHTGTQWRELADGRRIVTFRDNPPITGVINLSPGWAYGSTVGTYPMTGSTFWRDQGRYQTWANSDHKFGGTVGRTFRDADNPDGELGVAAAGELPPEARAWTRVRLHTNGLLLEPGAPVSLVLLRRALGRTWTTVGNANGSVELDGRTILVPIAIALISEPGQTLPTIDLPLAQLWFDGRTVNRSLTGATESRSELMLLDRDSLPGWTPDRIMDPGTGRRITGVHAQDPDLVWSQCGVHGRNIQFRLVRFGTVEASSGGPGCGTPSRSTPATRILSNCVDSWATALQRSTGNATRAITLAFTAGRSNAGVAEAVTNGVHVAWAELFGQGNDQSRTLAHEIGHVLGGGDLLFIDNPAGVPAGNLMAGGGPSLTREQCEVAYRNARAFSPPR